MKKVSPELGKIVLSIKPEKPVDRYVFPSRRKKLEGRPIVDVRKSVARAKKAAGIEKENNTTFTPSQFCEALA
jgi:hypothetical protein